MELLFTQVSLIIKLILFANWCEITVFFCDNEKQKYY